MRCVPPHVHSRCTDRSVTATNVPHCLDVASRSQRGQREHHPERKCAHSHILAYTHLQTVVGRKRMAESRCRAVVGDLVALTRPRDTKTDAKPAAHSGPKPFQVSLSSHHGGL